MSKSGRRGDVKPGDLTAYERWELPVMDAAGNEVSQENLAVKPLTAADLEQITKEAYEDGHAEGKQEGRDAGYKEGLQKGKTEGFTQGHAEGMQKGREEAFNQASGDIQASQSRLADIMEALFDPIRRHEDKIEESLLNLTLAICRSVISRELRLDSHCISRLVHEAIELLPETAQQVRVFVNPADVEDVKAQLGENPYAARIHPREDIHPGGVKVETTDSLIDFTVEKRFQKTIQRMLEKVSQQAPTEEVPDLAESMADMTDFHRDILESVDPVVEVPTVDKKTDEKPEEKTNSQEEITRAVSEERLPPENAKDVENTELKGGSRPPVTSKDDEHE